MDKTNWVKLRNYAKYLISEIDVILVGNKVDLKIKGKGVPEEKIKSFLKDRKSWTYFECSAKQNKSVK